MSKGRQLWPGETMRAFFRAHVRRETSLGVVEAERLANALTDAINRMLVWDMPPNAKEAADPASGAAIVASEAQAAPVAAGNKTVETFNPYLFSAMVVLAKSGREALLERLRDIKSVDHLRAFAEAQHVPPPPKLKRAEDIRNAIVAAVEQRLADRKAAAS